jgi:hypothetical protein
MIGYFLCPTATPMASIGSEIPYAVVLDDLAYAIDEMQGCCAGAGNVL